MARKKSNDLKLTDVKREAKALDKMETYTLSNEKDIHFYPVFKGTKIQELLKELQEKTVYAIDKGVELDESKIYHYTLLLCIKFFTHLGKDIPDTYEGQIEAMNWLIDKELFEEIINDVLDKKEVNKVFDKVTTFLATVQFSDKLLTDVNDKVKNLELQNKDAIQQAFGQLGEVAEKGSLN